MFLHRISFAYAIEQTRDGRKGKLYSLFVCGLKTFVAPVNRRILVDTGCRFAQPRDQPICMFTIVWRSKADGFCYVQYKRENVNTFSVQKNYSKSRI